MGIKEDTFVDDADTPKFHDYHANAMVQEINNAIKDTGLSIDADDLQQLTKGLALTYEKDANAKNKFETLAGAAEKYLTIANAAATYITKDDAAKTYLTKSVAASIFLSKADAQKIYTPKARRHEIFTKEIGSTTTNTDLNNVIKTGWYNSRVYNNKFTNRPPSPGQGAFVLWVSSIQGYMSAPHYVKQTFWDYEHNLSWIRIHSDYGWKSWETVLLGTFSNGVLTLSHS